MASPTRKLVVRRRFAIVGGGKRRKSRDRQLGSTAPNLLLDKPNANELAQKQKKS